MDEARLAALRAKYGDARGGDVFDPLFKSVADTVFQGERRAFGLHPEAVSLHLQRWSTALPALAQLEDAVRRGARALL